MASPEEMAVKMIANMPEKTGKALPEWLAIVKASGLEKHGEIVKHLKGEHGMTHGFANLVSQHARGGTSATTADDDLLAAQYAGAKAGLVPIRDALFEFVKGLGPDVQLSTKKSYVSLRRKKQFGLVQPSTRARVDLGLNLGAEVETTDRLEASGSFNSMVSHRVRLTEAGQVDEEVGAWMQQAYEEAG
jgi:predicted transport protein